MEPDPIPVGREKVTKFSGDWRTAKGMAIAPPHRVSDLAVSDSEFVV